MIRDFIRAQNCTLLCSGPMSKNCIDAAAEISEEFNIPQVLIASRRQIDSSEFGGGYVEDFTTSQFAQYVKNKKSKNVYLARDHGGPWQSEYEKNNKLSLNDAMKCAKKSFENDILAGFDYLHLDPSVPINGESLTVEMIITRLFELYGHVHEFAKSNGKSINFELGTEEQDGYGQDLEKFEFFLNETMRFCEKNKIKKPSFVVAQTGTKVLETRNVGIFKNNINDKETLSLTELIDTIKICNKYDVMLKEHNTDYLSEQALTLRPIIGIHASNVAPEFGVVETKSLLYILKIFGYTKELSEFINAALESKKWLKWMLPNSTANDVDKAIICGHYIFSTSLVRHIKKKVSFDLQRKGIELDDYLRLAIKQSMMKYVRLFKMI